MDGLWILVIIVLVFLSLRAWRQMSKNKRRYFDAVGKVREEPRGYGDFLFYLLLLDLFMHSSQTDEPCDEYHHDCYIADDAYHDHLPQNDRAIESSFFDDYEIYDTFDFGSDFDV